MSNTIRIFAVEDDLTQQENLQITLDALGYQLVGVEKKAGGILPKLTKNEADLILLDSQLAGTKEGIELVQHINKAGYPFVYLTTLPDKKSPSRTGQPKPHASLLKPANRFSLQAGIETAFQKIAKLDDSPKKSWTADVFLQNCFISKVGSKLVKILPESVMWITVSDKSFCEVVTKGHTAKIRSSLSNIEEKLKAFPFVRVHHSFVVNANFVEAIYEGGQMIQVGGQEIPLENVYKDHFLSFVQKM